MAATGPGSNDVFDTASAVYAVGGLISLCLAVALAATAAVSKIRNTYRQDSNPG